MKRLGNSLIITEALIGLVSVRASFAATIAALPPAQPTVYEHWSLIWYGVAGIAASATLLVVVCAALFSYRQIRQANRSHQLESALAIVKYVESEDYRDARKLLYNERFCSELSLRVSDPWSEANVNIFIKDVSSDTVNWRQFRSWLAALETMAILVVHDLAPDQIVSLYFGRIARRHWQVLQPLILCLRQHYESQDFLQHLEMLCKFIDLGGFVTCPTFLYQS